MLLVMDSGGAVARTQLAPPDHSVNCGGAVRMRSLAGQVMVAKPLELQWLPGWSGCVVGHIGASKRGP